MASGRSFGRRRRPLTKRLPAKWRGCLRDVVVSEYEARFPSAVKCFLNDVEACMAQLRLPTAHRRVIRTTNLLERLFGEERRRMKIVANAFGERAVLKLMYAALIRASETWR